MTQITVVLQNLKHGGFDIGKDGKGRTDRWPALAERLKQARPDILLLNFINLP